ncbi:MAG: transcriptional regulator GlxA family with amidase domain [Planctomycetota bacterium]|jgi:transcriptional regulator GlxA family with amidase domain
MNQKLIVLVLLTLASSLGTSCSTAPRAQDRQTQSVHPGRELTVGILIVDGVYNTELTAPMDMFHHTIFHTDPGMRVVLVGPSLEPVRSFEGLRILPDYSLADAPDLDILVVPSAEHSMDTDLENEELMAFVRERGQRAEWVMSLCDGAFILAGAGLLDGREATTFPSDRDRMAEMFPAVQVLHDVSFVHDGKTITSEGGARSFEPALYLCELLYGKESADGIAGGLVIDWDKDEIAHRVVPGE